MTQKMEQKKIAFIGAGNMAGAIIQGLVANGYPARQIIACNKANQARREALAALGVCVELSVIDAIAQADVVVFAVKPQGFADLAQEIASLDLREKWLVSIMAGMSCARIQALLPTAAQIVRAMPNTPALIGAGMTGLFSASIEPALRTYVQALFEAVGQAIWVENEQGINHIIALTGSSPAYFFRFMEAMEKQALAYGFAPEQARALVQSAALGAARMVAENSESLATLRENVTSKGGTTAQALAVFNEADLDGLVGNAMAAAIARAQEMEQQL